MFERFTEGARKVVVHAEEEARALGHEAIGSEHILLGILRGPADDPAAGALDSLGVTLADARDEVVRVLGRGTPVASGQMPFAPGAQGVLERSLDEARELRRRSGIGSEHLLLALVRDRDGGAARVLLDFDAGPERVRRALLRRLAADEPGIAETGASAPAPIDQAPAVPGGAPAGLTGRSAVAGVAAGALAFGAAVGIGLVLGRLIWG